MNKLLKYIERALIYGIIAVISVVLILAFIDIVYEIIQDVFTSPKFIVDASGLMDLFSLLLVLLIGLELLETVKAYLKDDIVHVEFIILVAIIAIARKVIVWDFKKYNYEELLSLAAMIVGLGVTFFLIKKSNIKIRLRGKESKDETDKDLS
ncbi:MAG: phosphate-starvation-inducible PsiE family protein [Bacteroidales bacterium]